MKHTSGGVRVAGTCSQGIYSNADIQLEIQMKISCATKIMLQTALLLVLAFSYVGSQDPRRPFYNIGHMANSMYDVTRFLNDGANGIETDITFSPRGEPLINFHGFPCDCFRFCFSLTKFSDYLGYIRQLATPGSPMKKEQLALLMLDLKVSHLYQSVLYEAGKNLAKAVFLHLLEEGTGPRPDVWVVLTVPEVKTIPVLVGFTNYFVEQNMSYYLDKFGYDVYTESDPQSIVSALRDVEIRSRVWMGDGISNCLPRFPYRLRRALQLRDSIVQQQPAVSKVYAWTMDSRFRLVSALRMQVDAILTNVPSVLKNILKEPEFYEEFRLANIEDIPWFD